MAVEAVCVRLNQQTRKIEVYMTQRSLDDTAYPGEWHCPGSIMRPGETINNIFSRLEKKEFNAYLLSKKFVANVNVPDEVRGHFISLVYLCTLEQKEEMKGIWFPTDKLPKQTVECHRRRIIPCALGTFVADCISICS